MEENGGQASGWGQRVERVASLGGRVWGSRFRAGAGPSNAPARGLQAGSTHEPGSSDRPRKGFVFYLHETLGGFEQNRKMTRPGFDRAQGSCL